jgi:hypothetical protein
VKTTNTQTDDQMLPAAVNYIKEANNLLQQAQSLLDGAKAKNFDTAACEKLIAEAQSLLDLASKAPAKNPIAANNMAMAAIAKLKAAIGCLQALE